MYYFEFYNYIISDFYVKCTNVSNDSKVKTKLTVI